MHEQHNSCDRGLVLYNQGPAWPQLKGFLQAEELYIYIHTYLHTHMLYIIIHSDNALAGLKEQQLLDFQVFFHSTQG